MRPQLHLTAPTGWINDPHGITFRDGRYHLFHQYVPDSMVHLPACHWGHAVSDDLLTWEHRPTAISPGDGDDGIWTGSLVPEAPGPLILYTSVQSANYGLGRIRIATPDDDSWDTWTKGDVVITTPTDLDLIAFRDPYVITDGDGWRMFVGAASASGDAMALTYVSQDLRDWSYDGVAARRSTVEREPVWTGKLWECPQFAEIGGRWVMISSVWDDDVLHYAAYGIGSMIDGRFVADTWGRLSFGSSYYAPSLFQDADGAPCLMFWMRGVRDDQVGWSSALSIPYRLSVVDDRLVATPHPAVTAARQAELEPADLKIRDAPIDMCWQPAHGDSIVLSDDNGSETARVRCHDDQLHLEREGEAAWSMPYGGGEARLLIDGPVIELSTDQGILGGAIEPSAVATVSGSARAWSLRVHRAILGPLQTLAHH